MGVKPVHFFDDSRRFFRALRVNARFALAEIFFGRSGMHLAVIEPVSRYFATSLMTVDLAKFSFLAIIRADSPTFS